MATKIKLMRLGKMRAPYYRIVVADARTRRDGRSIETIGKYHPKSDPSFIEVNAERAQYWLGVGAQPTEAVEAILKVTGDWQKFKGLPAPEPMKVAAPKVDKKIAFEAASKANAGADAPAATTPRKKKSDDKPADKSTDKPAAEAPAAAAPAADAAAADAPAAEAATTEAATTDAPAAEAPDAPAAEAAAPAGDGA